jgi:hypothetical protein
VTEVAKKQYADERSIDESEVRDLPGGTRAFRVDWGRKSRGRWILPLVNVAFVAPDTRVFASVGESIVEGDTTAGKFIGDADLTVQMVTTPGVGRIDVQVLVDFDVPVRCQVDYFVVPRF